MTPAADRHPRPPGRRAVSPPTCPPSSSGPPRPASAASSRSPRPLPPVAACVALAAPIIPLLLPRSASSPTTSPRPRPTTGTRSSRLVPRPRWWPSARPAWTATGTSRRFRSRKIISPATWRCPASRPAGGHPLPRSRGRRGADAARGFRPPRPGPRRDALLHRRPGHGASCLAMGLYISFAGMVTYKNAPGAAATWRKECRSIGCWWKPTARTWPRCRCAASATSRPSSGRTPRPAWHGRRGVLAGRSNRRTDRRAMPACCFGLP